MTKITDKQANAVLKKATNGSISAKDYLETLSKNEDHVIESKNKTNISKKTKKKAQLKEEAKPTAQEKVPTKNNPTHTPKTQKPTKKKKGVGFDEISVFKETDGSIARFTKINEKDYLLELKIRHLGKNSLNGGRLTERIRYKSEIKKRIVEAYQLLPGKKPIFTQVQLIFTFYNPNSRDRDANFPTMNFMIDGLVICGIIEDDNRKIVKNIQEKEKISTDGYKVCLKILQY